MTPYIRQNAESPRFWWRADQLENEATAVRHRQGRLVGHMESLGL
jgi:hypothetical protein